jgi:hypothetical protein
MPVMSRIPYQLAALSPGVQPIDQNQNVAMMWSINASSQIRVNGGRDNRSNEFLLDGMPNMSATTVAYIPPADSVAEFRVMSNAYDAQYGRSGGGTVNVSLKSGTNSVHGSGYEFLKRTGLNANTFADNAKGNPRQGNALNQYGFTLGGPIYLPKIYNGKDKSFFFFAYEGYGEDIFRANE